jgi:hypothetical protein
VELLSRDGYPATQQARALAGNACAWETLKRSHGHAYRHAASVGEVGVRAIAAMALEALYGPDLQRH